METPINCPACGFWAIHLRGADMVRHHYDGREGLNLRFDCESCGSVLMEMINHEGQTILRPMKGRRW